MTLSTKIALAALIMSLASVIFSAGKSSAIQTNLEQRMFRAEVDRDDIRERLVRVETNSDWLVRNQGGDPETIAPKRKQ